MMLQEYFIRTALNEIGLKPSHSDVRIDHDRGINYAYGLQFGLKYPKEYLTRADLIPIERKYKYAFSGNMNADGRRKEMLTPFIGTDSFIEENNFGRDPNKKYSFNSTYYSLLRSSYFTLCPHQADWKGPTDAMWTYRFIEAAFARSMPVVFRRAPCSELFMKGFHYYWDDEDHSLENYEAKLDDNRQLAEMRFFFTIEDVDRLKHAAARA